MIKMKNVLAMLVLLWSLALVGCSGEGDKSGEGDDGRAEQTTSEPAYNPAIYAVNYPLAYFAGRIAGDRARVEFPVPPDIDPAFWSPDAEAVAAFQDADLILLNGAGYARWVHGASLPRRRTINTLAGLAVPAAVVSKGK